MLRNPINPSFAKTSKHGSKEWRPSRILVSDKIAYERVFVYTAHKVFYCVSDCCQNVVAVLVSDPQPGKIARFYSRFCWQTCGGFVDQRLYEIARACVTVFVIV